MNEYKYHAKLGGTPWTNTVVDQARIAEYFTLIGFITGMDPGDARAILHRGGTIRHPRAIFFASRIVPS